MLTRWNDFNPLNRFRARDLGDSFDSLDELRRQMNRLFFDLESGYPFAEPAGPGWPAVSVKDIGSALVVRADVPGLDPKKLELSVDGTTLTIKGEREDNVPKGYSVHRKERSAFSFARSFSLPAKIDAEQTSAEVKNGVLTVTLPKAKEAQPRQISVRTS